ncbi:putative ABC transport system ATP-binding protein [Cognatiyoonia sediminum]|uniref:Putative ABC transport system ATP-binding protein n=1 Tax=Cognatiyoonia sediminum TaxID=1508389 RepID=A0A1M5RCB5_9RHOB|nr:ABC transporter ATP-binding protein [Cognatiyoonia sediminum]SHH23987.1 putative ABC transport system ATP-binding protein [Cognatiyoonia sediminum]
MTETVLQLKDVQFDWTKRAEFSLSVPDFAMRKGETVLLLGESGSGKSTLLSLICGTLVPQAGSIKVADADMTTLSASARDRFRAERIGVIFQQFNLLPFGTVADNIQLPLRFAPERRQKAGDVGNATQNLLDALGLSRSVIIAKASTLSVGQQQRVAVARALIGQPSLIIADEPTSALDAATQSAFLDVLFEQVAASGASLLMVSHDARLADRFDRTVTMDDLTKPKVAV